MEMKILLLVLSSILLSGLGIAETMHSDHPSSSMLFDLIMTSEPINTAEVKGPDELLIIKQVSPSLRNYRRRTSSLEKRISHETSEEKVQDETNKFNDVFRDKSNCVLFNFNLGTCTPSKNISSTEAKDDIMNQVDLMLRKSNSVQINTTTIKAFNQRTSVAVKKLPDQKNEENNTDNKEPVRVTFNKTSDNDNDNDNTLAQPRFHQLDNITTGTTNLEVNTTFRKSNQSDSAAEGMVSNNPHQHSNESRIDGAECCEGKNSQNIYKVGKDNLNRSNKSIEEDKLNDKGIEHLSDKILQSSMNYGALIEVNKQKNTFREIQLLMSSHFESLNIKQDYVAKNGNISITETIAGSQDIFELIEKLYKILKVLLESKEDDEADPSSFIKTIVEKQIEKCNEKYNKSKIEMNAINTTLAKLESNESIMSFIKCVNISFKKCLRNFGLWLFYLRPRFNLSKAYKMYQRIYVLDCR